MSKKPGMIEAIETDDKLKIFSERLFVDGTVAVPVDSKLKETEYIRVKVDDYFNARRPYIPGIKSVDFIVAVDCSSNKYVLYIMEFKGTRTKNFTTSSIEEKFENSITEFLEKDFAEIYCNDRYAYKQLFLYLVTTAGEKADEKMRRLDKKDSLISDVSLSAKVFRFRGKCEMIKIKRPSEVVIQKIL